MARPYRTKKLNAARSALLRLLSLATNRKPGSVPKATNPLAAYAAKVRKALRSRWIDFHEQKEDDDHVTFSGMVDTVGWRHALYDRFAFTLSLAADGLTSRVVLPGHAPAESIPAVLKFLAFVNADLKWGAYKIRPQDGELFFELAVPTRSLAGDGADMEVGRLVRHPASTFSLMATPLAQLMAGKKMAPFMAYRAWKGAERKAAEEDAAMEMGDDCLDDIYGVSQDDEDDDEVDVSGQCVQTSSQEVSTSVPAPSSDSTSSTAVCDLPADYDLDLLNVETRVPLSKIVAGAKRFQAGDRIVGVDRPRCSILLAGPSGAGKSTFARFLARAVGAPLFEVRASDILSPYVGESERRLAEVFGKAARERAILFLDEVDGLLSSRAASTQPWHVTQVNELLTQIEKATCILVAATNFAEQLDPAAKRRFTFKLSIGYLGEKARELLFVRMFGHGHALNAKQRARLAALENLTPGDFRTVRENQWFLADGLPSIDECLSALEAEAQAKGGNGPVQIGFGA